MKPEDKEAYRKARWEWATNSGGKDLGKYMFKAALAHRDAQPAVAHPPADVVQALVLASVQVAKVYRAMRKTLAEKYPQDGWSAEAMTLDTFDAALNKAKEHGL